ncbi:MAG: hypothetical protein B6U72_05530 [Candidatus Altiarchaeales archaeon ex4484_2]|nr:MAG: hypothetical protein B6U72_05530 [Candidatus Altiarchaeales archaeon ex4484_2]
MFNKLGKWILVSFSILALVLFLWNPVSREPPSEEILENNLTNNQSGKQGELEINSYLKPSPPLGEKRYAMGIGEESTLYWEINCTRQGNIRFNLSLPGGLEKTGGVLGGELRCNGSHSYSTGFMATRVGVQQINITVEDSGGMVRKEILEVCVEKTRNTAVERCKQGM